MIYLFAAELPENKLLFLSLTSIYGIGLATSNIICKKIGFSKNFKTNMLSKEQIKILTHVLESLPIQFSNDLKKKKSLNSKKLISIKSFKGLRKYRGLPIRGQRTHTNAKTSRKIKNL